MRVFEGQLSWPEDEPTAFADTLETFDAEQFITALASELPRGLVSRLSPDEFERRFTEILLRDYEPKE
jgi:hypothetical protein